MKLLKWPWKKKRDAVTQTPQNEYYENISAKLGVFQVLLYFSLLAFVVISFFANSDLITYRNFYYFFKDLNASAETVDLFSAGSVTYPSAEQQSFVLYRKGLAVAGNHSVSVFTATGRQTVSQNIQYQNPVAVGSGKYLLVYESGGVNYSLYNSYTQIFSGKSERPIYGATISDSGMYALVTQSKQNLLYSSVVAVYNSDFGLINEYMPSGYVMGASINAKGTRLALLLSSEEAGVFSTKLLTYDPQKRDQGPLYTSQIDDSLALSCAFTRNGGVGVLCTDGLFFVASDGAVTAHLFGGRSIAAARLGNDGAAVALKPTPVSQKSDVMVMDASGQLTRSTTLDVAVTSLDLSGDSVYFLTRGGVICMDVDSGKTQLHACNTDRKTLLAVDETTAILCSAQKADYIRFSLK